MTDWRARPRTGKSQFVPLLGEIRDRIERGETFKQIHDDLVHNERISLRYHQFVKYIAKLITGSSSAPVKPQPAVIQQAALTTSTHPFAALAGRADTRRNPDSSYHSSVPDKEKIYRSTDKKE